MNGLSRDAPPLERLAKYSIEHPDERLTAHLPHPTSLDVVEAILARSYVESVVLTERNDGLAARYPGRVGWYNFSGNDYMQPASFGSTFWSWKNNIPLGLHTTKFLGLHGVKQLVFASDLFSHSVQVDVRKEIIRCYWQDVLDKLPYGGRYGTVGKRIEHWVSEWRWRSWWRRLRSLMPNPGTTKRFDTHTGILLVTNDLGAGGSERQLVNTALGLSSLTSEVVSILCLSPNEGVEHFHRWRMFGTNIDVSHLPPSPHQALPPDVDRALAELWLDVGPSDGILERTANLVAEFIRRRPRVVHAWLDSTNIAAGIAAALTGVPLIVLSMRSVSPQHWNFWQPYMRPGYRALAHRRNVRLLNNSDAGAIDYARWLNLRRKLFTTLRNGVDIQDISKVTAEETKTYRIKIGVPKDRPVVGSIFRFNEAKRPMLWAKIAAAVARQRPDVVFLLVGDGPMRAEVLAYSEQEGFSDRLIMPGSEPNAALPLSLMTCLLLTSRMEGAPNAILEAHAAGIPVVTSAGGGAPETTVHGQCGWVVKGDDPMRYADRILQVLSDPKWRANAAVVAREFVSREFGFDRMISESIAVYGLPASLEGKIDETAELHGRSS